MSLSWTIPGTDRLLVWSDEASLTSTDCCQRRQYFWVDDRLQKEHFQSDEEPLSPPCVREIVFSLTIPNVPTTTTGPSRRVPSTVDYEILHITRACVRLFSWHGWNLCYRELCTQWRPMPCPPIITYPFSISMFFSIRFLFYKFLRILRSFEEKGFTWNRIHSPIN